MTTKDYTQIQIFFEDSFILDDKNYADVQYINITDQNQGSYSSNQIVFNLENQKQNFIVLSDSILVIPFSISSSANAYTTLLEFAFKQNALQLISGISITTNSGTTLISDSSDNSLAVLNTITPLIDNSIVDLHSLGPEFHFSGIDKAVPLGFPESLPLQLPCLYTNTITANSTNVYNPALKNQVTIMRQYLNNGIFRFMAYLPLKLIHPIFKEAFNFSLINMGLMLNFNVCINNGIQPLVVTANNDIQSTLYFINRSQSPSRRFCIKFM